MLKWPKLSKPVVAYQRLAFFGPMCSGKTWCADYLVENYGYHKVSFASKLKSLAYDLYGVQTKTAETRTLLQALGTDIRKHDTDVWIKHALYRVEYLEGLSKRPTLIVIDDLRYVNEAKSLKKNGFTLVHVDCDDYERMNRVAKLYPGTTSEDHTHPSETESSHIVPDGYVDSTDVSVLSALDRLMDSL